MSIDTLIALNDDLIIEATDTVSVAQIALAEEELIDKEVELIEEFDNNNAELIERNKSIEAYFKAQHKLLNNGRTPPAVTQFTKLLTEQLTHYVEHYQKETSKPPIMQWIFGTGTLTAGILGAYLTLANTDNTQNEGGYLLSFTFFCLFGITASVYQRSYMNRKNACIAGRNVYGNRKRSRSRNKKSRE